MTIPGQKGLGYKPDVVDERDHRFGASGPELGPAILRAPDVTAYVSHVRDQGGTSSCVGQALAAALEITSSVRKGTAIRVAPRWLYAIGREAEKRPGALLDDGSFPRLVMGATRERGVLAEKAFPWSEEFVNYRPAPMSSVTAYDAKGLTYYRIDETGKARLNALREALVRGFGVLFGMQVDADYMRSKGDLVRSIGRSVGGHMQAVVACESQTVTVLNSWGSGWGNRGFVDFDAAFFAEMPVQDVYAVTWCPEVSDA